MNLPFLGIPPEAEGAAAPVFTVIPVPFEASVSYGSGTASGPLHILEASAQVELYDTLFCRELPSGVIRTESAPEQFTDYDSMADHVRHHVELAMASGTIPVVLGGEHSVSVPAVEIFKAGYPTGTVIQLDAHSDLRDDYQGSRQSHACVMRRIREMNLRTVSIGIRSMSAEEARLVSAHKIVILNPESPDFWSDLETVMSRETGPTWLTLDIDVMDPSEMPGTGTPEPGGLRWRELMDVLGIINRSLLTIKGMDLVEFAPVPGLHFPDFTAAKLLHRMMLGVYETKFRPGNY